MGTEDQDVIAPANAALREAGNDARGPLPADTMFHAEARATYAFQTKHSPLRRPVTLDEIGGSALYLLSDLGSGVTGEIIYVDGGYNIINMPRVADLNGGED